MMVPTSTMDPEVQLRLPLDVPAEQDLLNQPVFPLIHAIKKDVEERIDASLSWDQLNAVDVNYSIFRPLVFKYAKLRNYAIVYACLVVRTHFIESASQDLAFAPLKLTRADACELLALKLLRRFTGNSDNPVDLFSVLTVSWDPLQGCPDSCMSDIREITGEDIRNADRVSALEIAISSEAKRFIASPLVQTCITDIYNGRVVFSAPATRGSILADNYKQRHVQVYDVHNTPWLDHYRLRVPRYRGIMEFVDFAILLFLFVLCLHNKSFSTMNWSEIVFIIFAFGFLLDELTAALEHGWDIYIQNMWNGFDLAFATIFIVYLGCRCRGLVKDDFWWNDLAYDILACGACILFPRLAFFAIKNNLIILALQGMIAEFFVFIMLAAVCFSGLLFTLWTLSRGSATWNLRKIAWLMTQVWFGNTFLSFTVAESFHPIFGPILMVMFAALSNTLLITIMISILSNTFARINEHASEEYLYQFAISTIEGVKSDALFSYQPPFNILALLFLYPLSTCLSPRQLHTANVFLIRITSFPQLIVIGVYERCFAPGSRFIATTKAAGSSMFDSVSRQFRLFESFMGTSRDDVMGAIFEIDVPPSVTNAFSTEDDREPGMEDSAEFGKAQEPDETRQGRPEIVLSPTPRRSRSRTSRTYREEQPPNSPLARLFGTVRQRAISAQGDALGDIRKIGEAMENLKEAAMPGDKLRQEIKELSERQARIETLLLTLTRGMRGEGNGSGSSARG
ncbi:Receptor-activated Ca2 -permeable cation channel, partial [Rhizoctonia solani]